MTRLLPVIGYEKFYEVSDEGDVRSLDRITKSKCKSLRKLPGRVLKRGYDGGGYAHVGLTKDGKLTTLKVHHLVLRAFIGEPLAGQECRHFDNDRANARQDNLSWGTRVENAEDKIRHGSAPIGENNPKAKLTEPMVLEIFALDTSIAEIAAKYGVSEITISHIKCGRTWMHVTGKVYEQRRVFMSDEIEDKIRAMKRAGHKLDDIAATLGISKVTACRRGKL